MKGRYLPLDVFRGFTVAGMILVNNPGSWSHVWPPFAHAKWHGVTFADLVFPFFLFMVGMSIFLAFRKRGFELTKQNVQKISKRTVIIFLLGMAIAAFPFFRGWDYYERFRIMGVLQRIALAYGAGALLCLAFKRNTLIWITGGILLGYWALLASWGEQPYSLEGNLALVVDKAILGEAHLWRGTGIPFDPEGLLSTLPSICSVLLGFLVASKLLAAGRDMKKREFVLTGCVLVLVGWVWGLVFPLNKQIWTSSFVIFTAGFALLFLACFILAMQKWGERRFVFHFFEVYGVNPLVAFVGSGLLAKMMYMIKLPIGEKAVSITSFLYNQAYRPLFGADFGSFLFALSHVVFWFVVLWWMYRKKWFVKV